MIDTTYKHKSIAVNLYMYRQINHSANTMHAMYMHSYCMEVQ